MPVVLADYVTLESGTGLVHTAPGHGQEDYQTGLRYGLDILAPVDERGRFTDAVPEWQGERVFEADAEDRRPPARHGRAARGPRLRPQLPALLALQESHRLSRHGAVVHRHGAGGPAPEGAGGDRPRPLGAGVGPRPHPRHGRDASGLVPVAAARLGRARSSRSSARRAARSTSAARSATTWPPSSSARAPTPGSRGRSPTWCRRARGARAAAARSSAARPTSSTCGSTRA